MGDTKVPADRPLWTLFFEGTLYKRYQDYLKTHDLTKILDSRHSTLSHSSGTSEPPVLNDETNWIPDKKFIANGGSPVSLSQLSPPKRRNLFLSEVEKKRRSRRTKGCIVLGVLGLGAIAAIIALVIHFVYVTAEEAKVSDSVPIKIPGKESHHNITGLLPNETFTRTVYVTTEPPTTEEEITTTSPPKVVKAAQRVSVQDKESAPTAKKAPTKVEPKKHTKLAESIQLAYGKTNTDGMEGGLYSCKLVNMANWTSVYVYGDKKPGTDTTLAYVLSSNGENTLSGNNSRQMVSFEKTQNGELETITLKIEQKGMKCEDQDTFTCGVVHDGKSQNKSAEILFAANPATQITLDIPVQIVEGQRLGISASWKAGYPRPWGNITWTKIENGSTEAVNFGDAKLSWVLRSRKEKCETEIVTYANFSPKLSFNATELIVKAEITTKEKVRVEPARKVIYVVKGQKKRKRKSKSKKRRKKRKRRKRKKSSRRKKKKKN